MRLLLLDNFDSFTYNIAHYVESISGRLPDVIRNNVIDADDCLNYDGVILSPGPGLPGEAGMMQEVIKRVAGKTPLLGICLGMQAIAMHYGCELRNLGAVRHGIQTLLYVKDPEDEMFRGIDNTLNAGSYHSWVVEGSTIPEELQITATDREGNVMAMSHKNHPVYGIQTHPESIMTDQGINYISNFLRITHRCSATAVRK